MARGWTFQRLIDERMMVTAYCHNSACNHSQRLDLEKLRDRFGPDAPAMHDDIVPKLRCAKCGSKKVDIRLSPDPAKVPGMWDARANAYANAKGD
ncbi:MAG: hypothetical protein J0H60_12645 [Rhizobiales bacterium]|nr:hypothetical protein [Hyphomicrobiales bacterium]